MTNQTTTQSPTCLSEEKRTKIHWWPLFSLTRLHRFPIGSNVATPPIVWGLLMAAHDLKYRPVGHVFWLTALWSLCHLLQHAAFCVWDDICDRDIDGAVERSKGRPLVTGLVTPFHAVCLALLLYGFPLATLGFYTPAILHLAVMGVLFLELPYPLMKRWTHWPQAWLGFTFGLGVIKGWMSLTGDVSNKIAVVALWLGIICWTIVYDTIYACQDRKDDVVVGIKSTAVLFGKHARGILSVFSVCFVGCLYIAGVANGQGMCYFIISTGGAACHLFWQLYTVDLDNGKDCGDKFNSNGILGCFVSLGLLCDYLLDYWVQS